MRNKVLILVALLCCAWASARNTGDIRLLYWNIQNGMWDGQGDNYDRFVDFVKSQNPDICVWCEAASNYQTGKGEHFATNDERYLPYNWDSLAERYGHKFVYLGGWRDNFPQVITSRFPIRNVKRVLGDPKDVIVAHGAGWAQIEIAGDTLNIVTVHTWPQRYKYLAEDRAASAAAAEGHEYRAREMQYICENTILSCPNAKNELWLMMGDFNAVSRVDNGQYGFPEDTTAFLTHDYIRKNTPYRDIINRWYDGKFFPSTGSGKRIDFIYCTNQMYYRVRSAKIFPAEGYLENPRVGISNFRRTSDHLPIMIDFSMTGEVTQKETLEPDWKDAPFGGQYATVSQELFGWQQFISLFRYPAKKFLTGVANDSGLNPAKKPSYPAAVDPANPATTTSGFAERYGAIAAINAGYFNMKTLYPQTFVKDDGVVEGHTTPDELFRVDGAVGIKGGHKAIFEFCDTTSYENVFAKCDEALACGPMLMKDGKVLSGWSRESFFIGHHPRSIVGVSKDGWIYYIIIDGRFHGLGEGASIPECAEICRLLGLHDALNLDGGGSTSLWVKGVGVLNHPFDNNKWDNAGERVVPNVIFAK